VIILESFSLSTQNPRGVDSAKKAIGKLYKQHKIIIQPDDIKLA